MQLSIAIITGNSERYIARFLRSFAPIVDEIVIVRASGALEPDATFEIARDTVAALVTARGTPKLITDEYTNVTDTAGWPHIDDYATARQLAFDLATNDWILWADTDDILDPDSAALIRSAFDRHHADFDAFSVDYVVPEDGLRVRKERIVNRTAGAWRYDVHEEFKFHSATPRIIHVKDAAVTHMPAGSRKPNDERNLRILERMRSKGTLTIGHRFHLVQSLRAVGRMEDSVAEATDLLKDDSLAQDERYELLMNLAELCPDRANQGNLYLQAIGVNPHRREAFGELAIWSIITGRLNHALGFAIAMRGIPRPPGYVWNDRAKYYGWFGVEIYAMALRVNGHSRRADIIQFNHFKKHGARISLLHATRGRASKAYRVQHEWLAAAEDPDAIEHIYALDDDDHSSMALCAKKAVVVPAGGGCVRAWNAAAAASRGSVLVQMSDDFKPPMHWDTRILERIGDPAQPAVLAVSDGHRTDDLLCMAILTRARYEQQGFMFHPDFEAAAMFSDNYFTDRAYRDDVVIEARDLVFEHHHPAFGKAPVDATYTAQNAPEKYTTGKAIFDRLTHNAPHRSNA